MNSRRRDGGAVGPAVPGLVGLVCLALGAVLIAVGLAAQVPDPAGPSASFAGGHAGHQTAAHRSTTEDATATSTAAPTRARGIPAPAGGPGASQGAAPVDPSEGHHDAHETDEGPDALPASEPVVVRVPAIDVSSPLHALGLAEDGTLEVPTGERVDQAAWYSGSPTPGEVGPAVIEGHVTGPGGRPSVFFELGSLGPGDRVEVDREDGTTVVFEVYRVERYPKDRFPTVEVYGQTAGPELRLITCGGEFDESTGHHVDNTVVYARVVPA